MDKFIFKTPGERKFLMVSMFLTAALTFSPMSKTKIPLLSFGVRTSRKWYIENEAVVLLVSFVKLAVE